MQKVLSHIKSIRNKNNSTGFSLVEVLVALSVFLVFVLAMSGVTNSVSKNARHVANSERAVFLAEEAIEASRNIRDSADAFANLPDGTYGLSTSGNQWILSGSSDTQGIFTRSVTISTISTNQKKVDVAINWSDQSSPTNTVNTSTYLTNWRAVLNLGAGITVNKIVINHGGSKVASDFGPYLVGTTTVSVGVATVFPSGTYTVSETTDPNYTRTFSGDCNASGSMTIVNGGSYSCTITNEEKLSNLTVTKVVVNNGGTKVASDFTLTVDSNPVVSGATNTFNSGVHTVSEVPDAQYTKSLSGDCAGNGSVTLVPGTTKACTVTNTQIIVNAVPTVTAPTSTSLNPTNVVLGATVSSLGVPATLSARGICYSTSAGPTLLNGATCISGTLAQTLSAYTVSVTGLIPGTTYYYSGYATNSTGTGYTVDGTFTTPSALCSAIGTPTTGDSSGTASLSVAKPTGVAQNDMLFAYIGHTNATDVLNTPTGWTQVGRNSNGTAKEALFYKIAGASEPANYTITLTSSVRVGASISVIRGCFNTANPIDTISNTQYVTSNNIVRAASMTLPSAYSTVIVFPGIIISGNRPFTAPTTQGGGWTTVYNFGNASSQFSRSSFTKVISSAGATGVIDSIVSTTGTTNKHGFAVGLKPN